MLRSQWNASMGKARTLGTYLLFLTTISAAKSMKSALRGTRSSRTSLRSTNIDRILSSKETPLKSWARITRLRQLKATNHLKSNKRSRTCLLPRSSTLPSKPCSQHRPPLRTNLSSQSLSLSLLRGWARKKLTLKPNPYRSHWRTKRCRKNRPLQAKVQLLRLRCQLQQQPMWQLKMCSLTRVHLPTSPTSPKKSWMSKIKIVNSRLRSLVCLVIRKARLSQFKKTLKPLIKNQQYSALLPPKKNPAATSLFNSKSK